MSQDRLPGRDARPNVVFVLADQLRASSLPVYGERQIATPHLDALAAQGVRFDHAISTCPLCTPYRAMLLTGRHPQTTGHVFNHVATRHDEISVADAFSHAGYRTGWVGKWHLHTAGFATLSGPDYVPEGRDRLGFDYWRGYNCHLTYFDGFVGVDNWRLEPWKGYETQGLLKYAEEFMDGATGEPFCLFLSPHQPHWTNGPFAPEEYYRRLPADLSLPANVPPAAQAEALEAYRHYLAMTLALDDMMGTLLEYLDRTGRRDNTVVVFTSDHGSQMGGQGVEPWEKMLPYEDTVRVPMIVRYPAAMAPGGVCGVLTAPVDLFPTLCGMCGVPVPRTVEGRDLSAAWRGQPLRDEPQALFTMNFTEGWPGYLRNGNEWRGVRTRQHAYARWLDGRVVLYDLVRDPLQQHNLHGLAEAAGLEEAMEAQLQEFLAQRGDAFMPCLDYAGWFDMQRRIVRTAFGPLGPPEQAPDFRLLTPCN